MKETAGLPKHKEKDNKKSALLVRVLSLAPLLD